MTHTILVLDANQRSALAVTRSLGKLPDIAVMTAESAPKALAGSSRFSQQYFMSPNASTDPQAYLLWLQQLTAECNFALVLPVTEVTSQLLLMNMPYLPHLRLPFTSYENLMQIADKGNLVRRAQQLAIPVPTSEWFAQASELKRDKITYPCVIKPCLSKIHTVNGWITTTVKIVHDAFELEAALMASPYLATSPFMIQAFIRGHGAGVFCLFQHGRPSAFFAHKRLREKPPQGGISVLSESVALDPKLQQAAEALLSGANWHGVAMVEFRIDDAGTAYVMEVNTRFWGSLQLAIDSGVDFPALLVSNELNLGLRPSSEYKLGQRLRWLLGDLDSLYIYLKSNYTLQQKCVRALQFLTPSGVNTRHEINRLIDLKPAWFELQQYALQWLR